MNFWEIEKWVNLKKEAVERGFYLDQNLKASLGEEGDRIKLRKASSDCCSNIFEDVLKRRIRIAVNNRLYSLNGFIIVESTIIISDPILVNSYLVNLRKWIDDSR